MELEALTLHRDGTIGIMYRDEGELVCTCGWPDGEAAHECGPYSPFGRDPRTTAITEADARMILDPGCTYRRAPTEEDK